MNNRIRKRKEALSQLKELYKNRNSLLIIHYSCESFYDIKDGRTPRITSIAVRNCGSGQTHSFSIHKEAEKNSVMVNEIDSKYDILEKLMLKDYFDFVLEHKFCNWIHWNMRDINYGFTAIEHRFSVLGGVPVPIEDSKKYDLGRKIIDIYSSCLIDHPRFEKLIEYNNMTRNNFLKGKEEAEAFDNKEFVKLHQSTLRKVDLLDNIIEKIMDGDLKTKAKWYHIYGVSPQSIFEMIQGNWIAFLIFTSITLILGGIIGKMFT